MSSASNAARHLTLLDDAPAPVDAGAELATDPTARETARERMLLDALDRRQRRSPVVPMLLHRARFASGETLLVLGYVRVTGSGSRPRSLEAVRFDRDGRLSRTWVVVDRHRIADVLRVVYRYANAESPVIPAIGRREVTDELDAAVA
jgi:hypothetical protein